MLYEYRETKSGQCEEISGTIQVITKSNDSLVGVSRRLTINRDIDQVKKKIKSWGVEWTKAWDITLLKLSKKYGPRQYNAIARDMKLDWEAVKNRLRKLLAKIKIKREAKV